MLAVVGLAVILDSVAVIVVFFVAFFLLGGASVLKGRRQAKSEQRRDPDPEALGRIARNTHIFDAGAVFVTALVFIYFGVSTGSILFASGSLLMVLGGFESRRLLGEASANQTADQG